MSFENISQASRKGSREPVRVYADGGVILVNPSPHGGTWAACHVNSHNEQVYTSSGLILPKDWGIPTISNNFSECYALAQALLPLPDRWSGEVYSDSKIALGRLFWGWKWTGVHPELIEMCLSNVKRLGKITPTLLDGHPNKAQLEAGVGKRGQPVSEWNVWCDKECGKVARGFKVPEVSR